MRRCSTLFLDGSLNDAIARLFIGGPPDHDAH